MKDFTTATDTNTVPASPPHHQSPYELSTKQTGLKKRTIRAPSIDEGEPSPNPAKRFRHQAMTSSTLELHPLSLLERCLMPYDVIKRIADELTSTDLFHLATVSKSAWASIKSRDETWNNLNKMARCDGRGIQYRIQKLNEERQWNPATYIRNLEAACEEHSDTKLETKPCSTCHRVVCDECRIHVAYRSVVDADADSPDAEHHASFFLDTDMYLLDADADAQASSAGSRLHDYGLLRYDLYGDGTPIEEWVNKDMREPGFISGYFGSGYGKLYRVSLVCQQCLAEDGVGLTHVRSCTGATERPGAAYCQCTLRSRYLDRWLCIPCYQAEFEAGKALIGSRYWGRVDGTWCGCGAEDEGGHKLICKWCSGEVSKKNLRV